LTHELDKMPESFFQLRKHICTGNISFKSAACQLKLTQTALWALLNNEVPWWDEVQSRAWMAANVGNVHRVVAEINWRITEQEILDMLEVSLNLGGDFSEVKKCYDLDNQEVRKAKARQARARRARRARTQHNAVRGK